MEKEKETKQKLLKCALQEFSDKGYMKASLRNICKNAGVTTGALYFFFKDKDDLFRSLVNEPLAELERMIEGHFNEEVNISYLLKKGEIDISEIASEEGLEDDNAVAREVLKYLFKNKDIFDLLLTKAQGSSYENIADHMVAMAEKHYTGMYAVMKGYDSKRQITAEDKFIIHWISHDQIDIFIHILTHCKSFKEGEKQLKNMMAYMIGGWFAVINIK